MLRDNESLVNDDQKKKVNDAVAAVREALKGDDADAIRARTDDLSKAMQEVGAAIYGAQQAANAPGAGGEGGAHDTGEGEEAGTIEGEFREV
jgi:molecular chaperone DnaK